MAIHLTHRQVPLVAAHYYVSSEKKPDRTALYTGTIQRRVLLNGTIEDVPVADINVNTPLFAESVKGLVMGSLGYDIIRGLTWYMLTPESGIQLEV